MLPILMQLIGKSIAGKGKKNEAGDYEVGLKQKIFDPQGAQQMEEYNMRRALQKEEDLDVLRRQQKLAELQHTYSRDDRADQESEKLSQEIMARRRAGKAIALEQGMDVSKMTGEQLEDIANTKDASAANAEILKNRREAIAQKAKMPRTAEDASTEIGASIAANQANESTAKGKQAFNEARDFGGQARMQNAEDLFNTDLNRNLSGEREAFKRNAQNNYMQDLFANSSGKDAGIAANIRAQASAAEDRNKLDYENLFPELANLTRFGVRAGTDTVSGDARAFVDPKDPYASGQLDTLRIVPKDRGDARKAGDVADKANAELFPDIPPAGTPAKPKKGKGPSMDLFKLW